MIYIFIVGDHGGFAAQARNVCICGAACASSHSFVPIPPLPAGLALQHDRSPCTGVSYWRLLFCSASLLPFSHKPFSLLRVQGVSHGSPGPEVRMDATSWFVCTCAWHLRELGAWRHTHRCCAKLSLSRSKREADLCPLTRRSFSGKLLPALPAPVWLRAGATCGRGMQDVVAVPAWPRCPSCANGSRFPIVLREHSHIGMQGIRFCVIPRGPLVVTISARRIADDGSKMIVVGAHNRSTYRIHKLGERRACVRAGGAKCPPNLQAFVGHLAW